MLALAMVESRGHARTMERLESSLQELTSAAQDAVNAIAPPEDGDTRSLVERLRAAPGRVADLCKTVCKQVIAVVRSYYPGADLSTAGDGIAQDCSDENYVRYLEEAEPIAAKMTKFISLEEL